MIVSVKYHKYLKIILCQISAYSVKIRTCSQLSVVDTRTVSILLKQILSFPKKVKIFLLSFFKFCYISKDKQGAYEHLKRTKHCKQAVAIILLKTPENRIDTHERPSFAFSTLYRCTILQKSILFCHLQVESMAGSPGEQHLKTEVYRGRFKTYRAL